MAGKVIFKLYFVILKYVGGFELTAVSVVLEYKFVAVGVVF